MDKRTATRQEKKRKKIYMTMNSENLRSNGTTLLENGMKPEQNLSESMENLAPYEPNENYQERQSQQPRQKRQYKKRSSSSQNQTQATGSIENSGGTDEQPEVKLSRKAQWIQQQLNIQMYGAGALLMKAAMDNKSEVLMADSKTLLTYGAEDAFPAAWAMLCDCNPKIYKWTRKALEATPYTVAFGMLFRITQELAGHHGVTFTFKAPFINRA